MIHTWGGKHKNNKNESNIKYATYHTINIKYCDTCVMQINMKHMHKIMTFTVTIFYDSMSAFACTKDPKYHQRIKYINI